MVRSIVLALCAAVPVAAQEPFRGPIGFEEGAPLQRLGVPAGLGPGDVLARGGVRLSASVAWANIFQRDSAATHDVFLDMERLLTAVEVRVGVGSGLEAGARLTLVSTWAGGADHALDALHNSLGLATERRGLYPRDAFRATVHDGTGRLLLEWDRTPLQVEEARFSLGWRVRGEGGADGLSLRGTLRVPGGTGPSTPARADGALQLAGWGRRGAWGLQGVLGVTTVRASLDRPELLRSWSAFGGGGVERRLGRHWAAAVQLLVSRSVVRSLDDPHLDRPAVDAVLGFVHRDPGGWRWEVALQEDLVPLGAALDFQVHVAVGRSW